MTFKASSNQVTVFIRAWDNGQAPSDKVFLDVMCMVPRGDIPVDTSDLTPTVTPTPPATETPVVPPTPRNTRDTADGDNGADSHACSGDRSSRVIFQLRRREPRMNRLARRRHVDLSRRIRKMGSAKQTAGSGGDSGSGGGEYAFTRADCGVRGNYWHESVGRFGDWRLFRLAHIYATGG